LAQEIILTDRLDEFLAHQPDVVAEAAGHTALEIYGADILRSGIDLIVISVGALAHVQLYQRLRHSEDLPQAGQLIICSGAIGGLDILGAAALSGLIEVKYTSRKPPTAWLGTRAETLINLHALSRPTSFFRGTAGEAARDYPQNANVAATIALCGMGLELTGVELIADPDITRNVHVIDVRANSADFKIEIAGAPSPTNHKTSMTTGFALARKILDYAKVN
jgi:aspartate dehydrogenase